MGYSMVHVDDLPHEGPGGAVRFVRRHLGVGAFGINWFVPVRAGTVMRFEPETTRVPIAGPDGLTMVAVSARRGSYEPRGSF